MRERLERALGRRVAWVERLSGGQVGVVVCATLADGARVVAKRSDGVDLRVEGRMLRRLAEASALPVPGVIHAEADLLVLEHLPGVARLDARAEAHLGASVAALHGVVGEGYGLDFDTLLGRFPQDNTPSGDWAAFFVERRLAPMTAFAAAHGGLPAGVAARLSRLGARLRPLLSHAPRASLLHGDLWAGNVLAAGGRVTGVLDPALFHGDAETDLAYVRLFGSFGEAFFGAYEGVRAPVEGAGERVAAYQLYPLLSHVAHFGGRYLPPLLERLDRLESRV